MSTPKRSAIELEYITDHESHRMKVVLPIETYKELLGDLHDLAVAFERRNQPLIAWEDVKRELDDGAL